MTASERFRDVEATLRAMFAIQEERGLVRAIRDPEHERLAGVLGEQCQALKEAVRNDG